MTHQTRDVVEIEIDRLTEAQLYELNHRIVERLRFLQQMRAHGTMLKFHRGERVRFRDRQGSWVYGTLAKYNQKTVTVISELGQRWNVSPGLLEHGTSNHESAKDCN